MMEGIFDDLVLANRLKEKEETAFETLIEAYGDRVLRTCFLIVKDLQTAEDLTQDVFIQVYRNIRQFKENSSLYTWIYKIVVNLCRNHLKKRKEYLVLEDDHYLPADTDVEGEVMEHVSRGRVKEAVLLLQPIYREVVSLFYFEDLSIKDICNIMGEPENTVKSKLHRARKLLKEMLEKEGVNNEGR